VVQKRRSSRDSVPVYIDLEQRETDYADCSTLQDVLEKSRPPELSTKHPIMWFLDGLDNLPGSGTLEAGAFLRDAYRRAGPDECFAFSTRPMRAVDVALGDLGRTWRLKLESLGRNVRDEWVQKHCSRAVPELSDFERTYPQHVGFLDVPVLFAMVLSTCLDKHPEGKAFKWDVYPGRAGLFKGFVTYMLNRRIRDERQTHRYEVRYAQAVEGVFWRALVSDQQSRSRQPYRIADGDVDTYLVKAFGPENLDSRRSDWTRGMQVLRKAGLILKPTDEGACRPLHALFAEYWAARHLARRFADGAEGGWFEAELWDHFQDKRLDPVLADALAVLSTGESGSERIRAAHKAVEPRYPFEAVEMMGNVGGDAAAALVHKAISTGPRPLLLACSIALRKIRSEDSVAALDRIFDDAEYEGLRQSAVESLGVQRSRSAVPPLLRGLKDTDRWVALAAAKALGEYPTSWVVPPLIKLLETAEEELKARIIGALERHRCESVVRALRRSLRSNSPAVRFAAVAALWRQQKLKRNQVVKHVSDLLRDPDYRVARATLYSLPQLDTEQVIAQLKHEAPEVRSAAADALGRLGDDQAVKPLAAALRDPGICRDLLPVIVGQEAGMALSKIGTAQAVKALIAALRDKRAEARCAAAVGLKEVSGNHVLSALIVSLRDKSVRVRKCAVWALEGRGSQKAVQPLARLLDDPSEDVRIATAMVLARLGSRQSVEPMLALLGAKNEHLRFRAVANLAHLEDNWGSSGSFVIDT